MDDPADGARIPPAIALAFFLSGVAALIYQTVWIRQAGHLLGGTVYAMSVVVATFMGGLAVGAALFGRLADRTKSPLLIYAGLEGAIALLAVLLAVTHAARVRLVVALVDSPDLEGTMLMRVLATVLMLGAPCLAIGGTLPVMVRVVVRRLPSIGQKVGTLYFLNTLGAALGALATGLFLIELVGLLGATLTAAAGNVAAAVVAMAYVRRLQEPEPAPATPATQQSPPAVDSTRGRSVVIPAVAFFLSGVGSLTLEMGWTRLLMGLLNNGPLVVSLNLSLLLMGFAVGGVAISRIADRAASPLLLAGVLSFTVACLALVGLGNAELFAILPKLGYFLPFSHLVGVAGLIVPAGLAMGALFPVLVRTLVTDEARVGSQLGGFYALNTIGTVVGAVVTPFVLIPAFGTSMTLLLGCGVFLAMGGLLVAGAWLRGGVTGRLPVVAAVVAVVAVLLMPARSDVYHEAIRTSTEQNMPTWANERAFVEGPDSTVMLYEVDEGIAQDRSVENRFRIQVDFSMMVAFDTNETKVMAHLPLLAVPSPKRALVICFGVGNTFRSSLAHNIDVDVVDINAAIPELARIHQSNPARTFDDPRGHIHINDGRNFLLLSDEQYDMITIDPAPPIWGTGMGNLHSREFFELVAGRLSDQGVAEMWTLAGNREDFLGVLRAFREAFPYVAVFGGAHYFAYHVLGSKQPIELRASRLAEVLANPRVTADLAEIDASFFSIDLLKSLYVTGTAGVDAVTRDISPYVDDHPVIEYRFLRELGPESGPYRFPREVWRPLVVAP